ncbi:MAG TPA: TonB family protein [bacterium]|uniref:Gram-negative bacterial tonB protein n=1 Tax=candidate division TA06 bacterium ADurb.Bin417 TaxID=1852828 RepID=A0A1V5ME18_UNCT6|nr:MAG: Gram-negative bacterial tonB protein [candidate division TA06 bacterium ADurb.Bin417]HNQ34777.1 TonB family protein [bacterium]HNS49095.1 TonB family protein [bacterium]
MRPVGGLCLSISGHLLLALLLLAMPLLQPYERYSEPVIFVNLDRLPPVAERTSRPPQEPPGPEPIRPAPIPAPSRIIPEASRLPSPRPASPAVEPIETPRSTTLITPWPEPFIPPLPKGPAGPESHVPAPPAAAERETIAREPVRSANEDRVDLDRPAESDYARLVRRRIMENLAYPAAARRRGQAGAVRLRFELDSEGRLVRSSVESGSGIPALDRAAVESIRKSAPFPAWTGSEPLSNRVFFITLRFHLN